VVGSLGGPTAVVPIAVAGHRRPGQAGTLLKGMWLGFTINSDSDSDLRYSIPTIGDTFPFRWDREEMGMLPEILTAESVQLRDWLSSKSTRRCTRAVV
jgi:hypothetical protein